MEEDIETMKLDVGTSENKPPPSNPTESEGVLNPFAREPSQRFKEAFDGRSLAYILLTHGQVNTYNERLAWDAYRKGVNSKLQKEARLVFDEII